MGVSDARRLRQLEAENGKLKQLLAEATLSRRASLAFRNSSSSSRNRSEGAGETPGGATQPG